MTREMEPLPDFTDNKAWFFIKLLVPNTCTSEDNTTEMSSRSYSQSIDGALKAFDLAAAFKVHFGRKVPPLLLEQHEIPPAEIKQLGNWSPDTQDKSYSGRMPMRAMRVMGGHGDERGQVFNASETCPPSDSPDEVEKKFFPWAETALNAVLAASERDGKNRLTAVCFLRLMVNLRKVLVQSVAVMMDDEVQS
jgi:hypothetical protein